MTLLLSQILFTDSLREHKGILDLSVNETQSVFYIYAGTASLFRDYAPSKSNVLICAGFLLCIACVSHLLENPCQTSEGITVMFHPDPIYWPARIPPSVRELVLPQCLCGGAAVRAAPQSHVAGTSPATEMNELMVEISLI